VRTLRERGQKGDIKAIAGRQSVRQIGVTLHSDDVDEDLPRSVAAERTAHPTMDGRPRIIRPTG